MAFAARNSLYVRHLSPKITEALLRETFGQCDDIERVLFRSFQGRNAEFFAQIDFKSSKGVLEGHKISGTKILGQIVEVSVMDPGSKDMGKQMWAAQRPWESQPDDQPEAPAEPQGVQAEAFRKFKEAEEDKRLRTVHLCGLDNDVTEENIRILCGQFGQVEAIRIDKDSEGEMFALIEFKEKGPATSVKLTSQFKVDGKIVTFSEAKTMVDTKSFAEQSVHFNQPAFDPTTLRAVLAYQSHLNPKLAKARMAAAEILNEPIPEDILKAQQKDKEAEEEPFVWAGRSEKDLSSLALKRDDSRERRSRKRGRGHEHREQGRERGRGRRRRQGDSSPGERRRRDGADDDRSRSHRRRRRINGRELAAEKALNASLKPPEEEDEVQAVGELVVLGESSSYSATPSPERRPLGDGINGCFAGGEVIGLLDDTAAEATSETMAAEQAPLAESEMNGHAVKEQPAETSKEAAAIPEPVTVQKKEEDEDLLLVRTSAQENISAALQRRRLERLASGADVAKEDLVPKEKWECLHCGEVNKPARQRCNNCQSRAPWLPESFEVDDNDAASSSSSEPRRRRPPKEPSPARSIAESLPKSVAESPARSIPGSSPRSISHSEPENIDLDDDRPPGAEDIVALSDGEAEECEFESERLRGEIADARARIFHGV